MPKHKQPTADSINKAIELLLWRCRDARIKKTKAGKISKGGYFNLKDWISKTDNKILNELEACLTDIQYANTGSADS
jgi:hypothetical protein